MAQSSPSSRIRPRERYRGTAPETTRSLTVPLTASLPISPPGKEDRIDDIAVRREGEPARKMAGVQQLGQDRDS